MTLQPPFQDLFCPFRIHGLLLDALDADPLFPDGLPERRGGLAVPPPKLDRQVFAVGEACFVGDVVHGFLRGKEQPLRLFDPRRESPFLLAAGDGLRFVPVDDATFDAVAAAVEAGRHEPEVEA